VGKILKTCTPSKGKKFCLRVGKKNVSYGAKGYRISPGTPKGDRYCARSFGIAAKYPSAREKDSPNYLSRRKWNCRGKKSLRKL